MTLLAKAMGVEGGEVESFLSDNCPPMGIYETLYAFRDSFGSFMGSEAVSYTHLRAHET